MKLIALGALVIVAALLLYGRGGTHVGGPLRLRHVVTVATPQGARTFSSVVQLDGRQTYNRHAGGAGWGAISCRLTGDAVRVTIGARDFYFLLGSYAGTPA